MSCLFVQDIHIMVCLFLSYTLVGMVVWYIGAGSGDGNPYGIVIATVSLISNFPVDFALTEDVDFVHCAISLCTCCSETGKGSPMDYDWSNYYIRYYISDMTGILGKLTPYLVVGYSWTNSHSNIIGNPGVGIALGWRRA